MQVDPDNNNIVRYLREPTGASIFVALINPYWAFGAEDFALWASIAAEVGIEQRVLLHLHLIPNKSRCRGHTVIFKWDCSISEMPEIKMSK